MNLNPRNNCFVVIFGDISIDNNGKMILSKKKKKKKLRPYQWNVKDSHRRKKYLLFLLNLPFKQKQFCCQESVL